LGLLTGQAYSIFVRDQQPLMMRKILFLFAITCFNYAGAQDRVFTYTYQSGVLNKGQKEIEVWSTFASGRENFYKATQHRMEFEVGLGGKLQTAFYLNYGYNKYVENNNGIQNLNSEAEYSFSNEWKLKLSDPVANRIGSAIYFEYTLAPDETGLEGKIILDKQTGNFISAFNLVGEYESVKTFTANGANLDKGREGEINIELNYGLSYRITNNVQLGLEVFNQNQIADSEWKHSVLFTGPCISYSTNGFWINLTCMPQITDFITGERDLTEHEQIQTRLVFSYVF
jgi:hypothetical protein